MSKLGTWADHIIIQAVANAHNLIIHITETAPNVSQTTIVTSIYASRPRSDARHIHLGHSDEMHYLSTPLQPTFEQDNSHSTNEQPKAESVNFQANIT